MGDETVHFMIALQDLGDNLAVGIYNVTVVVYGTHSANKIYASSLYVQRLNS